MNVINPVSTDKLTDGEKYTLDQKLKKLLAENECFIYVQPLINGLKPDFILIGKSFGVIIIEVKDWDLNSYYIDGDNNWNLTHKKVKLKSPQAQAFD